MNAAILRRLDALEAKLAAPAVEIDTRDVCRQLDLIAERRRARSGYRSCGASVVALIEKARAAERAERWA
jgi:hypothetical protein